MKTRKVKSIDFNYKYNLLKNIKDNIDLWFKVGINIKINYNLNNLIF